VRASERGRGRGRARERERECVDRERASARGRVQGEREGTELPHSHAGSPQTMTPPHTHTHTQRPCQTHTHTHTHPHTLLLPCMGPGHGRGGHLGERGVCGAAKAPARRRGARTQRCSRSRLHTVLCRCCCFVQHPQIDGVLEFFLRSGLKGGCGGTLQRSATRPGTMVRATAGTRLQVWVVTTGGFSLLLCWGGVRQQTGKEGSY